MGDIFEKIMSLVEKGADINKINTMILIAIASIKTYLNNDSFNAEYIEKNFPHAVVLLVVNSYNGMKQNNVKQYSQGSKSVTYGDDKVYRITEEIKALLPAPYIRMYK